LCAQHFLKRGKAKTKKETYFILVNNIFFVYTLIISELYLYMLTFTTCVYILNPLKCFIEHVF